MTPHRQPSILRHLVDVVLPGLALLVYLLAGCTPPAPLPEDGRSEPGQDVQQAAPDSPGPRDFAARALAHTDFRWDALATSTATVYTQPRSHAATRADSLAAEVDSAIRHALTFIGENAYPRHLRVFFVGSRDEMAALVGRPSTGSAVAELDVVFLVAAPEWRPLTRHEVLHAVSIGLWGHPLAPRSRESFLAGGWLREGLATAAEGRCGDHPLHTVVATMQAEGGLISLDLLVTAFYEHNDLDAHLQAGSLLDYVRHRYGADAIRRLWDGGPEAFPEATGATAAEVEADWQVWLAETSTVDRPTLAALREHGCG